MVSWKDYDCRMRGSLVSIGILQGQWVMERKTQAGMVSLFYKVTKQEADSFPMWQNDETKIEEILLRNIWCYGYAYSWEFRVNEHI